MYKLLATLLTSIKLVHREGATPVFMTVTDIYPRAGLYTDPIPAFRYLDSMGVDPVYRIPALVIIIDKLAR